ncbi:MAG: hypothetical protein GF347_02265 [Candidatus Moranbacteria bacterium]|nr:hypothetical protein [Candidatus Moranbacteria bacterium]
MTLSKSEAQKLVWRFINDFRDRVVKKHKTKIDFIIIYGSASRGEFVPGKSDVDILIQVYKEKDKEAVKKYATDTFWNLAKKYPELNFKKSISNTRKKKSNLISDSLEKLEASVFLFQPVFVFHKGEIDWKNGRLNTDNPLLLTGKKWIVPEQTVFLRFKEEGIILYGRDIRKEIKIELKMVDKLRITIAPQLLSFMGFLISPILTKKATNYSIKALLYQVDGILTALDKSRGKNLQNRIKEEKRILIQEYRKLLYDFLKIKFDFLEDFLNSKDFRIVKQAIKLKWSKESLNYFETINFCFKAWIFILKVGIRSAVIVFLSRRKKVKRSK